MTEDRVDRLARRLARSEPQIYRANGGSTPPGSAFDGVARALAAPVTRRRAVVMISGAVLAGSLLRPRRAGAAAATCECPHCWPYGPKPCESSKGAKVCVADNLQCCSNDNCAIACPYSYRDCTGPARCDDTARMCQPANHEEAGISEPNRTVFHSMEVTVVNGCVDGGKSQAIRGMCCRPNEDFRVLHDPEGNPLFTCDCREDPEGRGNRDCGDKCCAKGQICVTDRFGTNCKPPCVKGRHYDENAQCVCDSGETCRGGCCPQGQTCDAKSGRCVSPGAPSNFFQNLTKNFGEFSGSDTGNQTAGSRSGGNYFRFGHAAAGPGATPVRSALLLLAAVNAQGAAAANAFTDLHLDRSYRRRVVAARVRLPKLAGTPGFDPGAARALDALLAAEAKAFAQFAAAATALARSRGALRARNLGVARRQALAAGGFSSAAAQALRGVPALRSRAAAALRAAGVAEVQVGPADIGDLQDAVQASGIPAQLTGLLTGLGMTGDDLKRVRHAMLVASPSGGSALIAPLSDPARNRTITKLAGELAKYARSLRRTPIRRSRVEPLRVRPPRR